MLKINNILETKEVLDFLEKRLLIKQYKKSKSYILWWIFWKTDFKIRKPKEVWEWSFMINKQFRAFARFDKENDLIVYLIDNHQNF